VSDRRQLDWRIAVCRSDLDPTAKYVALVLDTWMDKRGFAWPSVESIAERCGLGERTVRRALRRLEEADLLLTVHSRGRFSNRYRAIRPNPVACDRVESEPTRSPETLQPGHTRSPTRSPVAGEAVKKPSRKPTLTGRATRAAPGTELATRSAKIEPTPNGTNAQTLVAFYVNCCREIGATPPHRVVGQVAQQVGQLVAEGYDTETVEQALRLLVERRQNPSTLASFVVEAQAGPRTAQPRREHIADRLGRQVFERQMRGEP
jgi:hypothetical protein